MVLIVYRSYFDYDENIPRRTIEGIRPECCNDYINPGKFQCSCGDHLVENSITHDPLDGDPAMETFITKIAKDDVQTHEGECEVEHFGGSTWVIP